MLSLWVWLGVPPRSLAGPRHHRNVTVRVVPPPRRLAARGVDPPRQRAGGWSPRCRRSEQEPPYAIALPCKGEVEARSASGGGHATSSEFVALPLTRIAQVRDPTSPLNGRGEEAPCM